MYSNAWERKKKKRKQFTIFRVLPVVGGWLCRVPKLFIFRFIRKFAWIRQFFLSFSSDVSSNASPALPQLLIMPSLPPIYLHQQRFLLEHFILKLKPKRKKRNQKCAAFARFVEWRDERVPLNLIWRTMWKMHVQIYGKWAQCWFAVGTFGFILFFFSVQNQCCGVASVPIMRYTIGPLLFIRIYDAAAIIMAAISPQSADMR